MEKIQGVYVSSDIRRLEQWVAKAIVTPGVKAFDTETTGLNPRKYKYVAIQLCQEGKAPFVFDARGYNEPDGLADITSALYPLVSNEDITLIGANVKFDLAGIMAKLNLYPTCHIEDVQVNEQIILGLGMSSARTAGVSFKLSALVEKYSGTVMSKQERNWFIDLDTRSDEWEAAFPEEEVVYMGLDVTGLFPIRSAQHALLERYKLGRVWKLECDTIPAIALLETTGIEVDGTHWMEAVDRVEKGALELESDLHAQLDEYIIADRNAKYEAEYVPWFEWTVKRDEFAAGVKATFAAVYGEKGKGWGEFKKGYMQGWVADNPQPKRPKLDTTPVNIGSSQQAIVGLAGMGVVVESVSKDVLSLLEDAYPIVSLYQEWKAANKLVVAFGQKLVDKLEGTRLYASYHQNGADTGRMSSHTPNLQQIPSKGVGACLRECVIAREGYSLVTADFSNIELRILAEYSKDKAMLQAFASGRDLHSATAVLMFGLTDDDQYDATARTEAVINGRKLGKTWRDVAKTINFGLVYGMSATKLATTLKIQVEDAKLLMKKYFDNYPGVSAWLEVQRARVDKFMDMRAPRAYSTTLSNRRRWYDIPQPPAVVGRLTSRDEVLEYDEKKQEYKARIASIRRQCSNSPIQGTSADITKAALAYVYNQCIDNREMHLVGVVHDEIIVEAKRGYERTAQAYLSSAMDTAQRDFLHVVTLPAPKAVVSNHWEH